MDYNIFKSGTDIRGVASEGVAGQEINLTDEAVENMAAGFIVWCEKKLGKTSKGLKIAIGHDSRISANRISSALCKVLTKYGVEVYFCSLASTPSMFMAVLNLPCDASVQITASHHPFNRNGLKFFTKDGGLESSDISEILSYAQNGAKPSIECEGKVVNSDFMKEYADILKDKIKEEVKADNFDLPLLGFKIVVDAGNGAGGFYANDVLKPLGADISGSQFLEPDGMFPNHIPNPEDKVAIKSISDATIAARADLGVIFDTDVDRGAAIDADGSEISRNALVAIAAAIATEGDEGATIVTDSITSDGLKDYIETTLGGKHHRFKRGYKNVINESVKLNNEGINSPLAIETSGHAAFRENYFLDDGAYLVTKIIIKMAQLRKKGESLSSLIKDLKHAKEDAEIRFAITAKDFKTVGENVIIKLEQYANDNGYKVADDSREGVRVSFSKEDGDGWLLLRLSVHDPVMPLNIESNIVGGTKIIANKLLKFFDKECFDNIDISNLKQFTI